MFGMDIKQIRYLNTRAVVAKAGGITALADKLGKSQSQVSAFAGINPHKGIGDKIARQIEEAYDLPRGWLDKAHDEGNEKLVMLNHAVKDFTPAELAELMAQAELIKKRKRGEL